MEVVSSCGYLSEFPFLSEDDERGSAALGYLLAPVTEDKFMQEIREQKCLAVLRNANAPNYYKYLPNMKEIENKIQNMDKEDFDLVKYIEGVRIQKDVELLSVKKRRECIDAGETLRVLKPQKLSENVWGLLAALEEKFACAVSASYIIANKGHSSFEPCFDDVDTFILQIEGSTCWTLADPPESKDVLSTVFSENLDSKHCKKIEEQVLRSGDLLYFPRGIVHSCRYLESGCYLSITTGHHNSWEEYLIELLKVATLAAVQDKISLRKSVPWKFGSYMGKSPGLLQDQSYSADVSLNFDMAVDQRKRAFLRDRLPPCLSKSDHDASKGDYYKSKLPISLNSSIRFLRGDMVCLITEVDTTLLYHSFDNTLNFRETEEQVVEYGQDFGPALEYLINAYPEYVQISDLPELDTELKIGLVDSLFDYGFLRFE